METILLVIFLNILSVATVFAWVWFVANKNKDVFSEKTAVIEGRIDVAGKYIVELQEKVLPELKVIQPHINDLKEHIKELKQENTETKELSKKVFDRHEEYHSEMLEKLNRAGELIVGYETFYDNSLAELDEVFRFVDALSKRPAVSSDPDFANFVRAVQALSQVIAKYTSIADELKKERKDIKTD